MTDPTALDVIAGRARWSAEASDNLPWLRELPDRCVDLVLTSCPYEAARTYGVGFNLRGQDWVDWLAPRVAEMARVSRGLVLLNAAPQVSDHSCSPCVEWLVADLTRRHGLVLGPAPYCYFRFSIPGSGGDRYHRRDWEPVYAFCLPDRLPLGWSDNKATGHAPRWAPGGESSNRKADGGRANVMAGIGRGQGIGRDADGGRVTRLSEDAAAASQASGGDAPLLELTGDPPVNGSHFNGHGVRKGGAGNRREGGKRRKKPTKQHEGMHAQTQGYELPVVANSGNVVREKYPYIQRVPAEDVITLPQFVGILMLYGKSTKTNAGSLLYDLREAIRAQALPRWFRGTYGTVLAQAVLRPDLYGFGQKRVADLRLPGLREAVQATPPWAGLLRRCLSAPAGSEDAASQPCQGEEGQPSRDVHSLQGDGSVVHPPQGREPLQQRPGQFGSRVPILSQQTPPPEGGLLSVREAADGARVLSEAFSQIQEVWRSTLEEAIAASRARESGRLENYDAEQVRQLVADLATRQIEPGDVIRCLVGGGQMGSKLAHGNEAPFPERLAEFFVSSYCPPGGVVLDPFAGSGTAGAVALRGGRRAVLCDLRPCQVEVMRERLGSETPGLFGGAP